MKRNQNYTKSLGIVSVLLLLLFGFSQFARAPTGDTTESDGSLKAQDLKGILVFSDDDDMLASVGNDGQITVLNFVTSRERAISSDLSSGDITDLAFSPDGRTLAGAGDATITLWDADTGEERAQFFSANGLGMTGIAFSPDGSALVGIANESQIIVWSAESGAQQWISPESSSQVRGIAFSPDSTRLAIHGNDTQVAVRDVASGQERFTVTTPSGAKVSDVLFDPRGALLASVDESGTIALWDADTGDAKRDVLGHQGPVTGVAFSPDGSLLASGGNDAQIKLWEVSSGQEVMALPGHFGGSVDDLRFSPDGATLASVGDDAWIVLWDAATGEVRQILGGDNDAVVEIAFSSDQETLASVGKDGRVALWSLETGAQLASIQVPIVGAAELAQQSDGLGAITQGSADGSQKPGTSAGSSLNNAATANRSSQSASSAAASVVATASENPGGEKPSPRDWEGITALALSPDGNLIGSAGEDGAVRVWDATGTERFAVRGHSGAPVTGVAFAGGQRLASVGRDSVVRIWDASNGNAIESLTAHEHAIRAVAASPDGQVLASAGEETRIMIWDASNGKLSNIFNRHQDFVNALSFSPDGKLLASGGADDRVLIWNVATGEVVLTLEGHSGDVNAVAFSPDGILLASGGADAQAFLWDSATGQQLQTLTGHQAPVRAVAFAPDGQTLVTAGEDNQILIWNVATGELLKDLPKSQRPINTLLFGPQGRLITGGEDSGITEWNVERGQRINIRRPSRQPAQPVSSLGNSLAAPAPVNMLSSFAGSPLVSPESAQSKQLEEASFVAWVLELLLPAASAQSLPDPNQGPGGPILVINSGSSTYGKYYAEILRNEGLNAFSVADIGTVDSQTLTAYDVVILAEMGLSSAQVTMLSDWVNAGGNLIAMRPDDQLGNLLGLTSTGSTFTEGYLLIDTSVAPGKGLVNETIQFHGAANRFTLSDASEVATLYSDANTATSNPAVTLRSVGANGGQAAAFAYDLATSIVYTRQGNPDWAAQERDGFSPIRSDDKFYGDAAGDPLPDWVDLNKVAIPQADEQQRLLANLIIEMNRDKKPLPRFWYFPRGEKAVVIMTGDDHANNGTAGRFDQFIELSPSGCSVENWECVRGTSYMYPNTPLTDAEAASYAAQGFEVGLHVNTNCADFTPAQLDNFYSQQISEFTGKYTSIPAPSTQRHHCIAWSDWVTGAKVQLQYGIRLDTSYYFWPPSWVLDRPGFFNGSAMPMRFADLDGTLIDVYNAQTQMTDESGQTYPFTIDTLLDRALGAQGYYGAFDINAHTDLAQIPESDAVVASAQARDVPIVTSQQMLDWLDGRNGSSFGALAWDGSNLSFTVTAGASANGLQALVPFIASSGALTGITRDGSAVVFTTESIKGIDYALFPAMAGAYVVAYAADTGAPTVTSVSPLDGATDVDPATTVTATFSEAMDGATINGTTFELSDGSALVTATVSYDTATQTATLTPESLLGASTAYTATVKGGAGGVTDLSGNPLTADVSWSFTTGTAPCAEQPCTIWDPSTTPGTASVNDPNAVELGVKFRSDIDGFISGIRFYKGSNNTGTHVGSLWASDGTLLAQATFANETASGWQQVDFASPVAVTANTVYVASYHAPNGNYAADNGYFASAGVDNAPLRALQDGESGGNGVYLYGSGGFPSNTFGSSNYWVDVVFTTTAGGSGPDTTPPTVTTTTPADGATDVALGTAVTVQFSEAMDEATIDSTTFELSDGGAVVAATVSYDGATQTATLTPASLLSASTTYTATVKGGTAGVTDLSGNPLAADVSWSFTTGTAPCADQPCTIWDPSTTPGTASVNDPNAVELGVKFRSDLDGFISGIRFYKGSGNTGTHAGSLWASDGTLLGQATFANETASGWQQVDFASPVAVTANTVYVASYHAPNGNYAADNGYFASAGVDNAPLRALQDGESGGNGVYLYGSGGFPSNTFGSSNYWVDVVFTTTAGGSGPDTTPPTVTTTTPADGATDVALGTAVTVQFSEAMDEATIDSTTFELSDGGAVVAATVSYEAATQTATLAPDDLLSASTTYTATVKGGAGGVTDLSGNPLTADVSWTFTTGTEGTAVCATPCSLWDDATTPSVLAEADPNAVELGVKFESEVDGFITGLRFYKSSQNTGTHVGSLWGSDGTLLAQATFANETTSGWQRLDFATPVAIIANTVYVASYHTTVGQYSLDEGYFVSAYTNGPLRVLQDGENGGNGVYVYGPSGFPTNTFGSSNYWVDVVFETD